MDQVLPGTPDMVPPYLRETNPRYYYNDGSSLYGYLRQASLTHNDPGGYQMGLYNPTDPASIWGDPYAMEKLKEEEQRFQEDGGPGCISRCLCKHQAGILSALSILAPIDLWNLSGTKSIGKGRYGMTGPKTQRISGIYRYGLNLSNKHLGKVGYNIASKAIMIPRAITGSGSFGVIGSAAGGLSVGTSIGCMVQCMSDPTSY